MSTQLAAAWNKIREVFTDEIAIILTKISNLMQQFYPYISDMLVNARNIILRE